MMNGKDKRFLEFDGFRLDPASASLWRSGELIAAPPKSIETLVFLAERSGEIVSRETLLDNV